MVRMTSLSESSLTTLTRLSPRRKDEPLVIPVNHGHDADSSGRQTPRVLVGEFLLAIGRFKEDLEHL